MVHNPFFYKNYFSFFSNFWQPVAKFWENSRKNTPLPRHQYCVKIALTYFHGVLIQRHLAHFQESSTLKQGGGRNLRKEMKNAVASRYFTTGCTLYWLLVITGTKNYKFTFSLETWLHLQVESIKLVL